MREIKQMMALAALAVSAYTDIRERNIYILPLIVASTGGIVISLADFVFTPCGTGMPILSYDLLFPAVAGIAMILLARTGRIGVGEGDGYLLACLGMLVGVRTQMFTFAAALICGAIYSGYLLISKRGRMKTVIPFAPFVMTGFLVTVYYGL
ncbi:MAG: prepilin peptidase [Lachnospiraceae bacterium]|nr:prepilin peptidase [Lachnospiraceae bacterium]